MITDHWLNHHDHHDDHDDHHNHDDDDDGKGRALQSRLKQMRLTLGAYVSALICPTSFINIIIIIIIITIIVIIINRI